ncbi:MAG: hypothetical protein J5518_04870 [Lachnospiraceae bacterium]|nr:hypothetical protein [Lachnospiraceae bacterium]
MWDYNRDGVIDEKDEDDYWYDEYIEEEQMREAAEAEAEDDPDFDYESHAASLDSRPLSQRTSTYRNPNSKGGQKTIGFWGIFFGGFFLFVIFCTLFQIDISKMSSWVFGLALIFACGVWYVIWKVIHRNNG